jgi:hypothetical protein
MMPSIQAEIASRANAGGFPHSDASDAIPSHGFGPIDDEDHILVLGGQGPELMCALLHAGATNVTHLRAHERPEPVNASLVIVPRVPSLDWLATALPPVRRALTPHGRLMVQAGSQPTTQAEIRRMLSLHGLTGIHARTTPDGQVLSSDLPVRQSA